jgi:hypothetical protein
MTVHYPRINTEFEVRMHTVLIQKASLLLAAYHQPMHIISQILHAYVSTFHRLGSATRYSHHLARKPADPAYSHIAITSSAHVILCNRNLTICFPASQGLIGVANNYVYC